MDTKGLHLLPEFEHAMKDMGFTELTEIQEKCIPLIQQGRDIIGLSHTGSGKTVAFGIPALEKVHPGKGIQLLVIVPTRELCNQVAKEFRKFTKYRRTYIVEVYGGVSIGPQIDHLRRADVVIGTPGRLLDVLARNAFKTSNIHTLVLDEADKMFEMGFIDDVKEIVSKIPPKSQKLLFGATMPSEILNLVKSQMHNPEKIKVQTYVDKSKLVQEYYDIPRNEKFSFLVHLVKTEAKGLTIIFCETRHIVDLVTKNLTKQNIHAQALHGGMSQAKRTHVMQTFHDQKLEVMVASDVAARGLDIKNVTLIINYDLPKAAQEYVHRIGRTARAGSEGKVVSLLSSEDHDKFRRILDDRSLHIVKMKLPSFEHVPFVRPQRQHGNFQHRGQQRFGQRRFSGPRRQHHR